MSDYVSETESPPDLPDAEYVMELVTWFRTYFGEIEECCTSRGIPRPPHW
jgi:hypothetical protein